MDRFLLLRFAAQVQKADARLLAQAAEMPRSARAYAYIVRLLDAKGPMTGVEISREGGQTRANVSLGCKKLAEAGLVHQEAGTRDGREVYSHLTALGQELAARLRGTDEVLAKTVLYGMTQRERERFMSLLARASASLDRG